MVESRAGANDFRVKMGVQDKAVTAREPEVDVVHTSNKDNPTIAVDRVIHLEGLSSERRGPRHQIRR